MSLIPFAALKFGAESLHSEPISYGKSRVSGNIQMPYILHCRAGCMPGQPDKFTINSLSNPGLSAALNDNQVMSAFKRDLSKNSLSAKGNRCSEISPFIFTYEKYEPFDDETFNVAKKAAYRQVLGNFNAMESEKPIDLERRLRNGDITIREFVRRLAKSEFYIEHFFNSVTQQRCIELSFKHLLGRPPNNQEEIVEHIELLNNEGFDAHIDSLIDSTEYDNVFGAHIVPYPRSWNSPIGIASSSFNNIAALTRSFATSDNAIHKRVTVANAPAGSSQIFKNLAVGAFQEATIPNAFKIKNIN